MTRKRTVRTAWGRAPETRTGPPPRAYVPPTQPPSPLEVLVRDVAALGDA